MIGDLQSFPDNESEKYLVTSFVGENRWKVNTYLITSKKSGKAFLIDAGGESARLLSILDRLAHNLKFILLTHGHFDHLSSAAAICAAYDLPCIVHPRDLRLARHAPFYAISFDSSIVTVPKPLLPMVLPDLDHISAWDMTVLETPGHTPGSCCYILDKFVFTGDTLIREAIGRTDQPGGNLDAIFEAVADILKKAPADGIIFPGHGRAWSVVEARLWWERSAKTPPQHNSFI